MSCENVWRPKQPGDSSRNSSNALASPREKVSPSKDTNRTRLNIFVFLRSCVDPKNTQNGPGELARFRLCEMRCLAAAGTRLAGAIRGLEAGAAGAGLGRVRIEDREAALHDVVDVVDLGAGEVLR